MDGYVKGNDVTQLASMLKLKAGRLGRIIPDKCLQYWGGMGFTNEVMISRMYRDMRLTSIGGGADEVMLGIISKYMGTLPVPQKKKKTSHKHMKRGLLVNSLDLFSITLFLSI